jgi:hypothetical protein
MSESAHAGIERELLANEGEARADLLTQLPVRIDPAHIF